MDTGSVSGEIVILPEYRRGYRNPLEAIGPYGPKWRKRRGGQGAAARPSPQVRIGQGWGGAPLSFPPLSPSLSSPNPTRKREGVLLPVGVGLLLARPSWPAASHPSSFIYGGTLETQQLIIDLLAVCGAPSTIVHLDNTLAVLRRSLRR